MTEQRSRSLFDVDLLRRIIAILGCGAALFLVGCGKPPGVAAPAAGGPGAAAPALPVEAAPANELTPAGPAGQGRVGQPVATAEQSPATAQENPEAAAETPLDESPDELFVIDEEPEPGFEIVEPEPDLSQQYEVASLPLGIDSTQFELLTETGELQTPEVPSATQISPQPMPPVETQPQPMNKAARSPKTRKEADDLKGTMYGNWILPPGFQPASGTELDSATGLPLRIYHDRDPVQMALFVPGVSLRGANGETPEVAPQHGVLLEDPFYLDVVEVSNDRYEQFRNTIRKDEGRRMPAPLSAEGDPAAPVLGVSYLDARLFARWTGKELPTEAQWERAARGTSGYRYPWGNGRPIWQRDRLPGQIDPVRSFAADCTPEGVFDLAGNAREWCQDIYAANTYQAELAKAPEPLRNPSGPQKPDPQKTHVIKGSRASFVTWAREGAAQSATLPDVGFRCALTVKPNPEAQAETEKSSDTKKKAGDSKQATPKAKTPVRGL